MKRFVYLVKLLFSYLTQHLNALFCKGANYSKCVVILSNVINDNINALMHILGKRQELTHLFRLRHIQRIPFG